MPLTTEQLTSTLSEALFHYREVLNLREKERDEVLPLNGKLPATEDDDALQAEYRYQLEAMDRFLGSVDDMVAAINRPNESSCVKYHAQSHPKWLEPFIYQEDESFVNPFTGLIVEAPSSTAVCSRPGPSNKEGPLQKIPDSFWESYDSSCNPSPDEDSAQKASTVPSPLKNGQKYRYKPRDLEIDADGRMDPYEASMRSRSINGNYFRPLQVHNPSSGFGDIKRENDVSLPGTWVNSWSNSTDEEFDECFPKAQVPRSSNVSRTTSKILGAGRWKTWTHHLHSSAAIQLEEIQGKKSNAKAKNKQNDILEKPVEQWTTAPETQGIVDGVEKAVRFSPPTTQSIELGEDGFQIFNEPAAEPQVTRNEPNISKNHPMSSSSSIETLSSGVSSTAEANWRADNERRTSEVELFENFFESENPHSTRNGPTSFHVANNPLEDPTKFNRQRFEIPEHPPQYGSHDQVAADEALAERLANFQADFQRPSDLFDEDDRESNSSAFMRKQYQQDRELAEMLSAGLDPDMDRETLELIKRLSGDSPQDFNSFLDQEAENEALIAELSDSHVLRDWELARQLAEDTPQDMKEHLRQLQEQEEYARLAQKAWDEDIRKKESEELATLAEMVRLEELERLERLRRERMADCTACSEEGEKVVMAMLSCSHGYCTGCIKVAFEGALREKKPFRCCDQVPIDSIATHFTQNFIRDYNDLMLELNTPNALYCSARNCSKFIPPTSIRADTGTCRACNSNTCRHCRSPSHTGICEADEDSTAVLGLAKEKGWKSCPGCHNMIERVDGCLHMTCTRCPNRTEFCYNCGKLYSICPATCSR